MKKILLLLVIINLVSCANKAKNDASDTDSIMVFDTNMEGVVNENKVEDTPSAITEKTEVTIDFTSYHLYTCEEDKYDANGYQPVKAKVTIDEGNNKATMYLYDSGENKWFTFNFRLVEKMHLQEGVITYKVYNNVNKIGYLYISTNRPGGIFIDINNFAFGGNEYCCWMQEGGSSGSQYRESVTNQNTPNTNPSYNSNLNGGSVSSGERIYGNYSNYPNYKETDDCVEGVVVYEGNGDYYIVETNRGYTVLERYNGRLDEGDKVRGELNKYNFKYLINRNKDSEVRVYIEDYMLSDKSALEWLGEHNHLKNDDQRAFDANN